MKKIKIVLVALLLLVLSFPTMAQKQKYALNAYYAVVVGEYGILKSGETDIDVTIDFSKSRVIIYSIDTQIIDFEPLRSYIDEDGSSVMESTATDSDYNIIRLEIRVARGENRVDLYVTDDDICCGYLCKVI